MATAEKIELREGRLKRERSATIANPLGYSFRVIIRPEVDGGFSSFVPELQGALSQGDTVDETIANMRDALVGLTEAYGTEKIPFTDGADYEWQAGDIETRIAIDVDT